MRTFIFRRILITLPVLLGITIFVFGIVHLAPGSPTSKMMDPKMTREEKDRLEALMGIDQPIHIQYVNWMGELVKGNLGYSTKYSKPVKEVIGDFMFSTFLLAFVSLIIALLIGIPAGVVSATRQYSVGDYALTVFSLIGISMPSFFFGLLLIKYFSIDLKWLPISGMVTPAAGRAGGMTMVLDVAKHLVLPAIVLGLGSTATFMRYTRTSMLEVIRQDYIRTARAKGLSEKVVIYRHALRNAMIPIITLLGFWVPSLFSGAVIVESIFAWPGMGKIGVNAVTDRDYALLMGINLFLAILTLLGNLLADILYGIADPRISYD